MGKTFPAALPMEISCWLLIEKLEWAAKQRRLVGEVSKIMYSFFLVSDVQKQRDGTYSVVKFAAFVSQPMRILVKIHAKLFSHLAVPNSCVPFQPITFKITGCFGRHLSLPTQPVCIWKPFEFSILSNTETICGLNIICRYLCRLIAYHFVMPSKLHWQVIKV